MDADFLVILAVVLACAVNRQSIIFVCAFALCEIGYHYIDNSIMYSLSVSLCFAFLALISSKIKHQLQLSLIVYSIIFWFASIDYLLFTHKTYFYAIFPYIIKVVDIYVLFQLINTRGRIIGSNHSAPSGNWV
jgi:hypothetical protein